MAIKTETLYRKLYDNLSSYGYDPQPINATTGKTVTPEEADFIKFDFDKKAGVDPVTIRVEVKNDNFNLIVHYDEDIADDDKEEWYKLLPKLRSIGQKSGIKGFELKNMDRLVPDLQKREYEMKKEKLGESDISGLLAAAKLNRSFIVTAETAEGQTKKFRVKAQSENVAKEKFMKHHSMAKILDVKEEHMDEGLADVAKGIKRIMKNKPSKDTMMDKHLARATGYGLGGDFKSSDKEFRRFEKIKNLPKKDSLHEFAQDDPNGGGDEGFNPRLAKMAYDDGVVKGMSLADGATLAMAIKIDRWDTHDGGIYKQYFAKGFKEGRMDKIRHENKQYNLNLKLMKDGSIKHGKQGVAEGSEEKDPVWNKGTPMPKDYTCHCGLYVHPSRRNPDAIHIPDCPYAKKQDKEQGVAEGVEQSYKVTYDIYGSNKEKPLYTKSRTVRANSEQEAINTLRKLVGGTNYRVEKQGVAEGWKEKAAAAALAGSMALGSTPARAGIGSDLAGAFAKGAVSGAVGPSIYKKQNDADTAFAELIPNETDKAKYLKALKSIMHSRNLSATGSASFIGANAVDEKHFKKLKQSLAAKYNIQMSTKEGVAEAKTPEEFVDQLKSLDKKPPRVTNTCKTCGKKWQLMHVCKGPKKDMGKNKEQVSEGYYPMGKQGSYSDAIPTTKIILQHTRKIEEGEQRYRNIAKIFVENMNGERFLIPTTKPGIARVYARHIAEGGTPYDERGKHITSLVEEYQKMAGFVRAAKNKQFNESAQKLVNEGINHYQSLRETLHKLCGHRGYDSYFESWTPTLLEDGEEIEPNLNELFVQETLDPRIESVMPILSRLQKNISEMKETNELAEWADSLIDESLTIEEENIPLKDKEDLQARRKAIQDILSDPDTAKDPVLKREAMKRKAEIEKEAQAKGLAEETMDEGMPSSVAKHKQDLAYMSPEAFAERFKDKTDEELMAMAWRHGYGKGSKFYVAKRNKGKEGVAEDLDANQKRAGQLGPTEKVGPEGAVGKLVGANESVEQDMAEGLNEMDSEGYKGSRDDANELGKKKEGTGKMVKPEEVAKDAKEKLEKAMDKSHKKEVKEGQDDLDAILKIVRK